MGKETLDEVIVLLMKGPHSYTAEDTVEIDCHGGVFVMKKDPGTGPEKWCESCGAGRIYKTGIFKWQN